MKIPIRRIHCFIALAFLSVICPQPSAFAQGTAFTYQGRLNSSGNPANGSYDLAFTLYNANTAGVAAAGPVTNSTVGVTNGLFTTVVDFGPGVFIGGSNWLEIAVSTNGANNFTTLAPRQQLTPAPYALYAPNAGNALTAASAGSVAAANITGALATAQLPASILTNGASGVNFSGTVAGNGLGITNLTIAALSRFQTPIVAWGQDLAHQTEVPAGLSNVVAIVAENASSLALKGDGTIVGWGNAAPPPGLSNVVAFAQGLLLGVALKSDGTVTNWPSGYTTPPAGLSNVTAVAAGYLFGMALRSNGMVVAWGYDNSYGQTNVPAGLSNVVAIAAGPSTTMALQSNGTVVAGGDNS